MTQAPSHPPRVVPPFLTALGRASLPETIDVMGESYALRRMFKNDFFAVTALYANDHRKVILKVQRQASFLLLPMRWVGRLLAAREWAALQAAQGIPGVPQTLGRWGPTGLTRDYIEGHPLCKDERVPDDFHARLRAVIEAMHRRGLAYVDLEKCENVLVGDDGRPYLFDFQIAWYIPRRWGGELWPLTMLRRWFQRGDLYHLVKLQRRTRPDQLSPEALRASYRKPWYVHLHRGATWPFTWCRRRILARIDPRRKVGERGRIHDESAIGSFLTWP